MGLDMSLTARKFINGYSHSPAHERAEFDAVAAAVGLTPTPDSPYFYVEVSVAYWRKANAIHGWFVDNCQDGRDECQQTHVEREKLEELRDLCGEVLDDPTRAAELLPVREGFFFGGTDYDEWYYTDIRETFEMLTKILNDPTLKDLSFQYQSSW